MKIELRSDTFTRPTKEMVDAMMSARIGDDVFGEDESTQELEDHVASLFGYESALYCVSGTMANQIAIHVHVGPGDEVICDRLSHIYQYEGGGIAANSMASVTLLEGERGILSASMIESAIKPDNVHFPVSRMVSLENTVNKGGGSIYPMENLLEIRQLCTRKGLVLHLDGARLWNAMVAQPSSPARFGGIFDSISVCLSKGLGAPIGSVLLGSTDFIHKARRVRKRWGGGWRQSGFMAAAGLFAIRFQVERLKEDHARATSLKEILEGLPFVREILPVETNIVIFSLNKEEMETDRFVGLLEEKGIFCASPGPQTIRFVTHLDFNDNHLSRVSEVLNELR